MNFLLTFLINLSVSDGGPIYSETDSDLWIVEPFNAVSSLAYLLPAVYWGLALKGKYKEYLFLSSCLPFLILGGIGSTLYHAFRNSSFLLSMDVFPILLVTFMVSVYFWIKILPKPWNIIFILVPYFLLRYMLYTFFRSGTLAGTEIPVHTAINISYFITGVMIFLPALILLIRKKFHNVLFIAVSCLLFMLGLLFREMDSWDLSLLPMGTHWLWHISTAAGTWFLGKYLYCFREMEIKNNVST